MNLIAADCPRGQVYKDCYLRKCEQNCENIRHDENCYNTLQEVCFPGCYCPEGLVKDGNSCVEPNKCKNCNFFYQKIVYDNFIYFRPLSNW